MSLAFIIIFCSLVPPTLCQNSLCTLFTMLTSAATSGLKPDLPDLCHVKIFQSRSSILSSRFSYEFAVWIWCRSPSLQTERPVKRCGNPGDASRSWTSAGPTISASPRSPLIEVNRSELMNELILGMGKRQTLVPWLVFFC